MKKYFLILITILLISCDKTDTEITFVPINITPEIILDGELYINFLNQNGEQYVINNTIEYQNLINQLTPILFNTYQNNNYQTPPDFNTSKVICLVSEQQFYLSNRLVIDNVIENQDNVTVTYHISIINEVSPALEQLVYMFKIPSTTKPIVFVEV